MTAKSPSGFRPAFLSTLSEMALMALAYLGRRKLRTILTTLAIVFGVALIFAINITLPSMSDAFKKTVQSTGGTADLTITSITGEGFVPDQALKNAASVKGVKAVTGTLRRSLNMSSIGSVSNVGDSKQVTLIGVDPATAQNVRQYLMSAGRFFQPGDTGVVILPAGIGELAPDLGVGATLPLVTNNGLQSYNIIGLLGNKEDVYAPQIILPLSDAQTALNLPGLINTIEIALEPGADRDAVAANVVKVLGSSFTSESNAESVGGVLAALQISYAMFDMVGLLALFLGAFLIFNTFRTVILERRRDLAMLRALGATRGQLTQMILVESLFQGAVGTLLGLMLGYLLAAGIAGFANSVVDKYLRGMRVGMTLNASAVLGAIALGLISTLLAGYWPARAASRISPLEGLRPSSPSDVRRAARWGLIAGIVIMVLAVLMLVGSAKTAGVGAILFLVGMVLAAPSLVGPVANFFGPILTLWYAREGDLARGNLTRQPGRVAITASTLMIGLASLVMIAALVNSLGDLVVGLAEHTFASDIIILPETIAVYNTVIGSNNKLTDSLRALPETQTVGSLRYAMAMVDKQEFEVLAIDPNVYPKLSTIDFVKGTPEAAYPALTAGRNTIVNTLTASALHLDVGSDLVLQTPTGPQTYRVAGVANDILSFKLQVLYISQANLQTDFHKTEDVLLMLNVKPGSDKAAALKNVQRVLADYPQYTASLAGEYRDTLIATTNSAMFLFYALAILILIPAALGLLNTLTINVLERTREIGMVRAVGGSKKQVRRIVTAEALLLGLFGAAAGVLAGIALSYGFITAFAAVGWPMPYSFPFVGIIAAIIVGVLLALGAAILPARNASRLDILRALQFE